MASASVGQRRIAEAGMPLLDRQLAGEDRGFLVVAIVEYFEQVTLGLIDDGRDAEVVDDQQIDLRKVAEEAGAVVHRSGLREVIDQARQAAGSPRRARRSNVRARRPCRAGAGIEAGGSAVVGALGFLQW